ncbi:MAG: RHS repeat-associated core domain-containing protein, partial [Paludibacteraceae bacterium]|nr:RHS repeat-associated core domain-containing protein [Paludibacteraceae bacterium]
STSYLTDHDGNVSQFVCYTPYGETLVDEHLTGVDSTLHNGTYRTRYLFNGKELDNETNLYYYGARYFEPKEILWYGCDPLREKYPFTSSYVYCNGNPVKFVDPDGRVVMICKVSASVGVGLGYGLSGRIESGIVFDKYGTTTYTSFTGNHFNNQNLEEGSRTPRIFGGLYAGASIGVETNWKCKSYSEYANSFSCTVPVCVASLTIGEGGFGISLGAGFGIAIETSPTSYTYSLSMTTEEFGFCCYSANRNSVEKSLTFSYFVSYDMSNDVIQDKDLRTIGYKGVACIMDNNGNITSRYDVTCGVDASGNPNQQWETLNYTQNKDNGQQ